MAMRFKMKTEQPVSPKYYIMNVSNGTITHGPLSREEVKEMIHRKFHDNPNFKMMESNYEHTPGDVIFSTN